MTKIYNAIASNGILTKDEPHSQASLKKLNLFDLVFVGDKLHSVVAFDSNGNPLFACGETEFNIVEVENEKPAGEWKLVSSSNDKPKEMIVKIINFKHD